MTKDIDIQQNRDAIKYERWILCKRVLWGAVRNSLFNYSPRIAFGWRRFLLRCFGAKIGRSVNIYATSHIYFPWNLNIGEFSSIGEWAFIYNLGKVTIGRNVTLSQRIHICAGTHDYQDKTMPLLKPPVVVGDNAWVCADSFVGPNVTIGEGAVVGACSVVVKDVAEWKVVAGNPARVIKDRVMNDFDSLK